MHVEVGIYSSYHHNTQISLSVCVCVCLVLDVRSVLQAKEIVDGGDHHKIITMPLYLW